MKQLTFVKYLLVLMVPLLLAACSKKSDSSSNGSGSSYYVSFDLNGVPTNYNFDDYGSQTYMADRKLYTDELLAYHGANSGLRNALTILIMTPQPLAANLSFRDPQKAVAANGDVLPQVAVNYYDASANGYISAGQLASASGTVPIAGVVADAQVTITEFTSDYIKGSFSATVYKAGDISFRTYAQLTNGKFYVKRIQ
jgi:hypothetical protein